jgi:hypothetical protein
MGLFLIIIPQGRISFQKFIVTQMAKKFPAFFGNGSFIIVKNYIFWEHVDSIFRADDLFLRNVS